MNLAQLQGWGCAGPEDRLPCGEHPKGQALSVVEFGVWWPARIEVVGIAPVCEIGEGSEEDVGGVMMPRGMESSRWDISLFC